MFSTGTGTVNDQKSLKKKKKPFGQLFKKLFLTAPHMANSLCATVIETPLLKPPPEILRFLKIIKTLSTFRREAPNNFVGILNVYKDLQGKFGKLLKTIKTLHHFSNLEISK